MEMTREEWLERRRKHLCASDAAPALGLSKWGSPLRVCQSKWGELDETPSKEMLRGTTLEPLVIALYRFRTGHRILPERFIVSELHPFMAATPDGFDDDYVADIQAKTSYAYAREIWGESGSSDIPDDYRVQVQHEMSVTGAGVTVLPVLFADESTFDMLCEAIKAGVDLSVLVSIVMRLNEDDSSSVEFAIFEVKRDDEFIEDMIEQERRFWETYVLKHERPPCDEVPEKVKKFREASDADLPILRRLRKTYIARKVANTAYDDTVDIVKGMIGDHAGIVHDEVGPIRWKASDPKAKIDDAAVLEDYKRKHPRSYAASVKKHTKTEAGDRRFTVPRWK